ncbi:hypothetical protein NA56DRAFT_647799 [Hyaloscypha hepaticicola]|uniref:Uncharacterized protein n=1 Tax=Hyaloscypha hepaticicola TaxID=2082293 RepID=A0A2J6PX59_9HELO|nr:hypothetical protein NA56DRAFT_647799 [Hyaloscypha hepaticicola]
MIGLLGLLLGYLTLRAMTLEIHNQHPHVSLGHEQVLRHEHTHFIAVSRPHQR